MPDARPSYSLRRRLIMSVLAGVAAVFLATAAYLYAYARHEIGGLLDAHLAQSASLIVAQMGHAFEEIEVEHAPELHERARRVAFQVWEGGGVLRLHSVRAPAVRLAAEEQGFSDSIVDGRRWRVFSTWDDAHRYLIQVGERIDARAEIAQAVGLGVVAALAIALPVLAVIVWLSIGKVVAPLRALGGVLADRRPDDLAPLSARDAPAEVEPLVASLNRLLERVGSLLEAERRFTADAAHELRTPLAALKAQAQVARGARTATERTRALDNVIAATDRAARLTEQLLTLARLEPGVAHRQPLDLRALARQVAADAAPAALARNVDIEVSEGGPVTIEGDETLLAVLLRNLVDNAVRYGGPGGSVRLDVTAEDAAALLAVTDRGPGIPAAEREKVGQRFYRILGTSEAGSGLGLSIVRRIAEMHHAHVGFSPGDGGTGLRVALRFPRPAGRPVRK